MVVQDYKNAFTFYSLALDTYKNDSSYYGRGIALVKLKEYKASIADFTEAIRLNPEDASYWKNRGSSKMAIKDYSGAIKDYTQVLRVMPGDGSIYKLRGIVHGMQGDRSKACSDLKEAEKLKADDASQIVKEVGC